MRKLAKLIRCLSTTPYAIALIRQQVAAGVEHEPALRSVQSRTVVDIGANRGQFALAARRCYPEARIISFEPLAEPAEHFRRVFGVDPNAILHCAAIGPAPGQATMHVSARDDSSSLLPITPLQAALFPGTSETSVTEVQVGPLDRSVTANELVAPALLKIDVQGYELEVLRGCESLLDRFAHVYAECSFVELYSGQALAGDVIAWLRDRGFTLRGVYNMHYDRSGRAIQADFLFSHQ